MWDWESKEEDVEFLSESQDNSETTLEVLHELTIYIRSQSAEATPPLGTVLGNLGVNSIKFCKEFNEFTQDLAPYITLGVSITVMENRSYSFLIIRGPTMGQLLSFLRYEGRLWEHNQWVQRNCISLKAVIQLALYGFPRLPLHLSLPTVIAFINASALVIIYETNES